MFTCPSKAQGRLGKALRWYKSVVNMVFPGVGRGIQGRGGQGLSISFSMSLTFKSYTKNRHLQGAWVAQSVKHPTSAQVMISRFVSLSPTLGSLLSTQSLLQILCPPSPLCPSPALSFSKINNHLEWVQQIFRTYSSCLTETLCLLISNSPFPPAISPRQPLFHSDSMNLAVLETSLSRIM